MMVAMCWLTLPFALQDHADPFDALPDAQAARASLRATSRIGR